MKQAEQDGGENVTSAAGALRLARAVEESAILITLAVDHRRQVLRWQA